MLCLAMHISAVWKMQDQLLKRKNSVKFKIFSLLNIQKTKPKISIYESDAC